MGSAFTPVQPRRGTPSPDRGADGFPDKRTRQASSLKEMWLEKVDEEDQQTLETVPDNQSTSASEASSKGSNHSQPPALLDFINNTCVASASYSAWFTNCFPCAVVDINESDDYVVDKLSRRSAMNVMYMNQSAASTDVPEEKMNHTRSDQEKNLLFVQTPDLEQKPSEAPISMIHSMPSIIQEEEDEVGSEMDDVSLDNAPIDEPCVVPEPEPDPKYETPPPKKSPKNKKKFSVKKMFSRKKRGKE
ncbi:hypothetical protein ACHAWF_008089 [Thalassiosira exigua]